MAKLGDFKLVETRRVEYALGIYVTFRPMPNPDFDAYLAALQRSQGDGFRKAKAGSADEAAEAAEQNDKLMQAVAHTVVANIEGADDCAVYTPEYCLAQFRDPEMYDFWAFCRAECSDTAKFRKSIEEAATKN